MLTLIVFSALVFGTLALDVRAHRYGEEITIGDATKWSLIYIAVSLGFAAYIGVTHGAHAASLFLTGYVIEKALSVDNLMVFGAVFAYFGIPATFQHRILRYGIIGAIVFRLIFVTVGVGALTLIGRPVEFAFAAFVAWSAWKMMASGDEPGEVDHANRWYIRWTKRFVPVTTEASRNRFFLRESGIVRATPIFLCAVAIEITDVMFSFDSVPAVISVTRDPVLVYSSMVFAIMGLRAMYFVLEVLKRRLVHLGRAVALVLVFVATKLMLHAIAGLEVDPFVSLAIVLVILACGVIPSMRSRAVEATKP